MERHEDRTKCVINSLCLHESDIPRALLGDRDPQSLTIPELKHWLVCRNASINGKKWILF